MGNDKPAFSLMRVIDAIEDASDNVRWFANVKTGEVDCYCDPLLSGEEYDEDAFEGDEWLPLPGRYDRDDWRTMRDYADALGGSAGDELLDAIHGSGAFRNFRRAIERLGALQSWLSRVETGEQRIPYILSWYGGEIEVGEETVTSAAENLDIETFSSDADGNAAYSFTLKNGEGIRFDNVKEGAKYTVTELANRYEPSYTIDRTGEHGSRRLDSAGGGTRADLTTAEQTIPAGSAAADNVVFTNSAATKCLKLTKYVESESARRFPFAIHLSGLTGVQYYAVKEGDAQAKIASDRDGNFTISITGSSCFSAGGDLSGIPVRIIRSDGADRTMCTDAQGKIPQSLYRSWLTEVGSDKNYTVEFLGQTFSANWDTD